MRGYQLVIQGYIFSSFVFFFVQTKTQSLYGMLYGTEKPNIIHENEEILNG